MAAIDINQAALRQAYRYANLIRNANKRRYASLYISWLIEGAVGMEPEQEGLSYIGAQAVRLHIASLGLWER